MGVERKFRNLENRIMEDVVRRIKKTGEITSSADYQLNRYYILGNSTKGIEDIVKSAVGDDFPETFELYDEVIEKQYTRSKYLYEQVNEHFIPYEENQELQQLTAALIQQSNDELYNITKSMGFMVDMGSGKKVFSPLADYYNEYLDNAMVEITSGAFDYNSVIRRVVGQMTNSGLRTVEYASGRTSRCDVAARRAIMTGLTQLTGQISQMNAQKLHTDYFDIDWHAGARPTHRVWQGKVWSSEQLITVCGLGTVSGLLGANCYHEYYPFIPGASERQFSDEWLAEQNRKEDIPKTFKGKEYTLYEATQRQRYLETNMRAQRQKVKLLQQAGADPEAILLEKCKYQAQLDEYKAFSRKMGLKEQRERIYYDLQGRVAPSKAAYAKYLDQQAEKARQAQTVKQKKSSYTIRKAVKGLPDIRSVQTNADRENFARKLIDSLGIDRIGVDVKVEPINGAFGYCGFNVNSNPNSGICNYIKYCLDASDPRADVYKVKTAFHESYHLALKGKKWDALQNGKIRSEWVDIEETFAESAAHYAARQYGIKDRLSPSYSDKLVENLPKLKQLPKYRSCKRIEDFGRIAWEDRLAGNSGEWGNLYSQLQSIVIDEKIYYNDYYRYIAKNKEPLIDKMLENMPTFKSYKSQMIGDLTAALNRLNNGEVFSDLSGNERTVMSSVLINAMERKGIR